MSDSLRPHGLYSPWNSLGPNTGVGSLSLLKRIFPTQGSNPGLPHYRQILYQLSHKGSPNILILPHKIIWTLKKRKDKWRHVNLLPRWHSGKESTASEGDARGAGSISGLGRSFGVGNGNPLQYSCLENSMDRGAWWATVHRVSKSWTRLSMHDIDTCQFRSGFSKSKSATNLC